MKWDNHVTLLNKSVYVLTDDFRIMLTQISTQAATVQLVNQQGKVTEFPQGFRIRDTLYNEDVPMIAGRYVIIWNASYEIFVNDTPCARIINERQVTVFKVGEGEDNQVIAVEPAIEEEQEIGVVVKGVQIRAGQYCMYCGQEEEDNAIWYLHCGTPDCPGFMAHVTCTVDQSKCALCDSYRTCILFRSEE